MVNMSYSSLTQRKGGAVHALTPGELEGRTKTELYLTPTKSAMDFIPAFKSSAGRRLPITDAFDSEAAQLQEADLDLRHNHKLDRVFGNGLFEDSAGLAATYTAKTAPAAAKRNNLFEDQAQDQAARDSHDSSPGPLAVGSLASRRFGSTMRPSTATPVTEQATASGTAVEAFNEQLPMVVARPRAITAAAATSVSVGQDRSLAAWEARMKQLVGSGQREAALKLPAPSAGMVRCYIKRVKNFLGTHCSFQMHLESGDTFLMAARRRKKSKTSSYVMSLDLEDLKRDTPNCVSKVKANFMGTEYTLWDRQEDSPAKKGFGAESLCINFKTVMTTKGGPRAMFVVLPLPEVEWNPVDAGGQDSLSNALELAKRRELPPYLERKLAMLSTKPPEWDDALKAYTLDFHGRVKEASVKNFQLVHWDHNTDRKGADLVLQFGKMHEDMYALDFAYPLTPQMAFSVALASIDTKLCYTL